MPRVAILAAARTPIGKFGGGLSKVPAVVLGRIAIQQALAKAQLPVGKVEEVLMGNCIQAGLGQNPARQAQLGAEIPNRVGAVTINKVCGSGMMAVMLGAVEIRAGDLDLAVAGGMESMSLAPYLLPKARTGLRYGDAPLLDAINQDSLQDAYGHGLMGKTADATATAHQVSREEQDRFAVRSHQRAARATEEGRFKEEIVAVPGEVTGGAAVERDEGIRADASVERLAKLRPAFHEDGTVTPGNASQLSDGGAALLLASESKVKRLHLEPLAWIRSSHIGGVEPARITESPIPTVREHLEKEHLTVDDLDLVEMNEAFAVAAVAFLKAIPVPDEKFNVNGGAVALGHPIGCTGARLLVTLLHEMRRRKAGRGLATLCMGGGNGLSMIVEAP